MPTMPPSEPSNQMKVVTELWNIYTYYSLHGDPLDPEHLRSSQLIKMFSDCGRHAARRLRLGMPPTALP